MADEESDNFGNLFGDIIQSYEVYDFMPMKDPAFHVLTHTHGEYGNLSTNGLRHSWEDNNRKTFSC